MNSATHRSGHVLDLILSRPDEKLTTSCTVQYDEISDHFPVICNLDLKKPHKQPTYKNVRRYRNMENELFQNDLIKSLENNIDSEDPNEHVRGLWAALKSSIDTHAPVVTVKDKKRPLKQWYNEEINCARGGQRQLERRWRKSGLTIDKELLQMQRKKIVVGLSDVALDWFSSYIKDRLQSVIIGNDISSPIELMTGIPQGSVLGPLLFLIYMVPIQQIFKKHGIEYHSYADNTQLFVKFPISNPAGLSAKLCQLECFISDFKKWLSCNKLRLNDSKTEFMVLYPKRLCHKIDISNCILSVGFAKIKPANIVRNLGSIFDKHMNMENNISSKLPSAYYQLHRISKIRNYLDQHSCKMLVNSLVTSRIDFNNSLLAGPSTLNKRLQVVQNHAARLITRTRMRDHVTPILKALHWLPITQRVKYKILVLTHKCIYEKSAPEYLQK